MDDDASIVVRGASWREDITANPGPRRGRTGRPCRNVRQLLRSVNASFQWSAEEAVLTSYYWDSNKRGQLPADTDQHTRKAGEEKISDEQLSAVSGKAIESLTCTFVQTCRPSSDAEPEQNTHRIRFSGSNIAALCSQISSRSAMTHALVWQRHANQTNTLPTPAPDQC